MTNDVLFSAREGDCTEGLQRAIGEAAAMGARLVLAAGAHHVRGIRLPSRTRLHLAEGAVVKPAGDYEAYAETRVDVVAEDSDRAIFAARNETGILIDGPGVIEAPGEAFIAGDLSDMGTWVPARFRPRVLVLDGCADVRLEGITIRRSPMWTLHFIGCRDVVVEDMTIDNDRRMPNTDGIVIDSCVGVTLRRLDIATADDGIVLKTTRRADGTPVGPCRDVTIADCRIESRSCALKIGTESHSDFEDILFTDCTVTASNRGLGLFSRDGGRIRNVVFRRIALDCGETPDGFWGSGEAITVNVVDRRLERPAGAIEGIVFEEISGRMEGAVNLVADGAAGITGVAFRNVRVRQEPGVLGTGRRYDVRPTRFDLAPAPEAAGRANAYVKDEAGRVIGLVDYPGGMPALFASNVMGLDLSGVELERPSPLPEGWNAEATVVLEGEPRRW